MKPRISYMAPDEVAYIRKEVLRWTITELCDFLIDPNDGEPISKATISKWAKGDNPVPLWAARRLRDLAEKAKAEDAREA